MTIRLTVVTYRQRWSRSAKKPRRQTLNSLPPRTEVTDRVVSDTSGSVAPELVDFREITTVIGSRSVESQLQASLSSARGSPDSGEPRQARWLRFRRSTPQSPRTSPRRRHRHVRAVYGKYRGRAHEMGPDLYLDPRQCAPLPHYHVVSPLQSVYIMHYVHYARRQSINHCD